MRITFKRNHNSKLEADYYIAILTNKPEYHPGASFQIYTGSKYHHDAEIVSVKHYSLNTLEEWMTLMDVNLPLVEYKNVLKAHFQALNPDHFNYSFIVFRKKPSAVNEKIALFCRFYEEYSGGVKYKISKAEIGMINRIEVTEELLKVFFNTKEWWAKVKSVTYYVRNINEIRLLSHRTDNPFPSNWDAEFAKKIPVKELNKYYSHLRKCGFSPVKDKAGYTLFWKKKSNTQ